MQFKLGGQYGSGWISFAKTLKSIFFKNTEKGWMPPIVLGEKDGELVLMLIPPQIDKYQGLNGLSLLRQGFDIDSCVFLMDAFVQTYKNKDDMNQGVGVLQKAFEEGDETVTECLNLLQLKPDGVFTSHSLPYVAKEEIEWKEDDFTFGEKDEETGGFIIESICDIMKNTPYMLDDPKLINAAKLLHLEDKEKQAFHVRRACRNYLKQQGFLVIECLNVKEGEEVTDQIEEKIKEACDLDPEMARNLWGLTNNVPSDGGDSIPPGFGVV
jgi:hypothetical protein